MIINIRTITKPHIYIYYFTNKNSEVKMTKKIIFLRHTQCLNMVNRDLWKHQRDYHLNPLDAPLSASGIEHAKKIANELPAIPVLGGVTTIDLIIASPFRKCIQTAKIIREILCQEAKIWAHDGFAEGILHKLPTRPVGARIGNTIMETPLLNIVPDMSIVEKYTRRSIPLENIADEHDRVINTVNDMFVLDKNILVITHGRVLQHIYKVVPGAPKSDFMGKLPGLITFAYGADQLDMIDYPRFFNF